MNDIESFKDDFESFLDEVGEYEIGSNFSRFPSEILYEMDEIAYNEQLQEFIEQKKNEYFQKIFKSFPAPVAYYFYLIKHGYENDNHRLFLLRDIWESIIYILYALVMGEVNQKSFSLSGIRVFENQRIRNNHNGIMSDRLGWKLESIQKIIEYDKSNDSILKSSEYIDDNLIQMIRELNDNRNSISHSSALSPEESRQKFNLFYPKVEKLLLNIEFFENISLLKFADTVGSVTKIRFFKFNGHSLQKHNFEKEFEAQEIITISPILNQENLLILFEDIIFNVKPFINFYLEGVHLKLCFYKKTDRETNEYLFEIIGGVEREIRENIGNIENCINDNLGNLV